LPPYRRPQHRWRSYRDIADAILADQSGADQGSEARKQSGAPPVLDNVADTDEQQGDSGDRKRAIELRFAARREGDNQQQGERR
jgi:hypothetical protein